METDTQPPSAIEEKFVPSPPSKDAGMDVDDASAPATKEEEPNSSSKKEESVPMQADDDDAVEY